MKIDKLLLSELPEITKNRLVDFLCSASFEDRSCSIPEAMRSSHFKHVFIFTADDCASKIGENAQKIRCFLNGQEDPVCTKTHDPLFTANAMAKVLKSLIDEGVTDLVLDISTFTHEMLLILLGLLNKHKQVFKRITCLYVGAREYSVGDSMEKKWLSKGCKEVRSVVGFPGRLVPGRSTALTVLVGFEHERAARMIDEMAPDRLFLGMGHPENAHLTNESHKAPMQYFQNLVKDLVASRGNVTQFKFSCRNLYETAQTVLGITRKNAHLNHIVVPLNTKMSTVAVALAAIENPAIQICYAEPETYNFSGYSSSDNEVSMFDLPWEGILAPK